MKSAILAALVLALGPITTGADRVAQTPMARVASLIRDLQAKVQQDGMMEQKSYDKYACWCEETLGRKVIDISNAKKTIEDLEALKKELSSNLGSLGASIKNLKDDIAENLESQREATEVRDKEASDYNEEKTESEQCIGALEAAIRVLTGAGSAKKGFLETLQEAQLLSVVAGVRGLLANPLVSQTVSGKDLDVVKQFVQKPEQFVGRGGVLSAAQIANNPFGDYAPQSTQIQGILKGMYDAFTASLEKANVEEADQQKAFEEVMATKKMELQTLQTTLEKQNLDEAEKTKKIAEAEATVDDTKAQLKADEQFFAETKAACKVKATEWSERSRLRTEELLGIGEAIDILTNEASRQIFLNATTTFLQTSPGGSNAAKAYAQLKALARQTHQLSLADLAVEVKTGGHFDAVIASIDQMIEVLRKEATSDIEHRDRCQGATNANKNDMEDLNHAIDKSGKSIMRMEDQIRTVDTEIDSLQAEMKQTQEDMAKQLELRNAEVFDLQQSLKDDAQAVELLQQAIVALSKFYKRNKIALELRQEPEYTVDKDKAPETIWKGANYGGRKDESVGIIAILGMLREDLEREMEIARKDDAAAQEAYEKGRAAAQEMLDAQTASKIEKEQQLADLEKKKFGTETQKGQQEGDLKGEEELKDSLYADCSWVASHFEARKEQREAEIAGLQEAKSYLAGVESGSELAP